MTFQFRPVLTVFTVLGLLILIGLGTWQLQRREWKLDLLERTEARLAADPIPYSDALARAQAGENMEYHPVEQGGSYEHALEAAVFGTLNGAAGVYIFTPLDVSAAGEEQNFVYVNRGFVPQALHAQEARESGAVTGAVSVTGLFRGAERTTGLTKFFRPDDQPEANLWFSRDPVRFAARHNITAPSYYIDSFGRENPAPWPKGGTTRLSFPNRHLEYALTWYGLALALAGVYFVFSTSRKRS